MFHMECLIVLTQLEADTFFDKGKEPLYVKDIRNNENEFRVGQIYLGEHITPTNFNQQFKETIGIKIHEINGEEIKYSIVYYEVLEMDWECKTIIDSFVKTFKEEVIKTTTIMQSREIITNSPFAKYYYQDVNVNDPLIAVDTKEFTNVVDDDPDEVGLIIVNAKVHGVLRKGESK